MSNVVEVSKLEGETITLRFNMLSRMGAGETPQTAICGVETYIGEDETPSSILSGSATVSGYDVLQTIIAGEEGVIYKISCAVRTSDNNILMNQALLAVLPSDTLSPPP